MSYKSTPKLFGNGYNNYDKHGRKIGETRRQLFGIGYNHYDKHGHKIGETRPGLFGGYNTYDKLGQKVSHTTRGFAGSYVTRKNDGKTTISNRSIAGIYHHNEGCYIATCVYGSYDAPEVIVLRHFRDHTLMHHAPGRLFVRIYYSLSPKLVKLFGQSTTFRCIWRKILDPIVSQLQKPVPKAKTAENSKTDKT